MSSGIPDPPPVPDAPPLSFRRYLARLAPLENPQT